MRLFAAPLLWLSFVCAQPAPPSIEGYWEGAIQAGGRSLRIGVTFTREAGGQLSAKMDSPDQGAFGLPLTDVSLSDGRVKFALRVANGSYEGKLNAAGTEIQGNWTQGMALPLTLKRTEKAGAPKRPQEPKPPYPYKSEDVSFPNEQAKITLAGTLTLPPGAGPFPAVVLITGSGAQNRDEEIMGHKPFLVLADHLTRHGIAVLRYDDRGFGKSQGSFATATSADFATDAEAAWQYLRDRKEIDPKRIGLLGHSEGGLIAPMVAARKPEVAFLVLLAGPAVTGEQLLYQQSALILKAEGAGDEMIAAKKKEQEAMFAAVREETDAAKLAERIRAALPGQPKEAQDAAIRQMASPWIKYFLFYDPAPALAKVKVPVLALNGELDLQVPAEQNLPLIAATLKKAGNNNVTTVRVPKANHLFQTCVTGAVSEYAKIEETLSPHVLETVSTWLRERNQLGSERHAVVWNSPSQDSKGSMPLGNGDAAINLWMEPSGDLVFYVGKSDAWSENIRLLKLGRVRVKIDPSPVTPGAVFRQVLKPEQGQIEIATGDTTITAWVDVYRPVVHVEVRSLTPRAVQASLENWRTQARTMSKEEAQSAYGLHDGPTAVVSEVDTILPPENNQQVWYHRNAKSPWAAILKHQGLGEFASTAPDPLLNVTFGGLLEPLSSPAGTTHHVQVHVLTAQTATVAEWRRLLRDQVRQTNGLPLEGLRRVNAEYWREFWERSWIRVDGSPAARQVSEGYALQRFINAGAGRGRYPIKFNGSLFTVDADTKEGKFDADYRRWGGPYWFQNTRLPYWSMVMSGDWDMMEPLFRMYREALPLAEARSKLYFNVEGASFPETMYFFGAYANSNYGWNRAGKPASYVENTYIRHYFSGALELTAIMLDRALWTRDREFARINLLPLADSILKFYDQRFSRNAAGKMVIKPAGVLENHTDAVDPLPEIAGLRYVLPRLLELPRGWTTNEQRAFYAKLLAAVPELPEGDKNGKSVLLPAREVLSKKQNVETPELYAVFPYRLFGAGKASLDLAIRTYEARDIKGTGGWRQDAIHAAQLGLGADAAKFVAENFSKHNPESRFPAFWGPNYDWTPDQDHGAVAMTALQRMLLQCDGDKMHLFPAWPKEWDVDFQLRAPGRTIVRGSYRNGKLERLSVDPPERRTALLVGEPQ